MGIDAQSLRRLDLPLLSNGVGQAITKRARRAGVNLTAHSFRRGLATRWLRSGGSEVHLMRVAGWSSPRMVARYTSAVATEEALRAARGFLQNGSGAASARNARTGLRAV